MADNVVAGIGTEDGATFATDEVTAGGTRHYPLTKIELGAMDSSDGPVSSANPMPTTGTITGDALTALQLLDDIVATDDTSTHATGTTKGAVIMAAATPTDGSVAANDLGAVAMSTDRRLHVDAQIAGQDADVTIADGGNSITVDSADLATLAGAVAAGQMQVDIVADGAGLATETTLDAVKTAVEVIDNAVATEGSALGSGVLVQGDDGTDRTNVLVDTDGHLQVDVLSGGGGGTQYTEDDAAAANPVGTTPVLVRQDTPASEVTTNGDVIAQRATQYGAAYAQIVDSSGSFVDTFGGGTQYTEDDVAAANPVGTNAVFVREDAPTSIAADGDVVAQRGTEYGAGYVQIVNSSGNFVDSFGGSGGTSHVDDAAYTVGTDSVTPAGYLADETTPDSVDEGDVGVARMTLTRKPYAVISDPTSENNAAVNASGQLQVDIAADSAGLATETTVAAIQTAVEILDDWDETNRAAVNLVASQAGVAGGTGADAANALRVSLATDIPLPAGTNAIGKLAANSGVDIGDVDVLSIAAGTNLVGDVGISGARTSGGTTVSRQIDVDETEDEIKGTAGQLYWIHAMNLTAAVLYLHVYNATAASVTVGTTTPALTFPLATPGDTNGAGFTFAVPNGIAFGTAITIACTTTIGGSSGPATNGCVVNLGYA